MRRIQRVSAAALAVCLVLTAPAAGQPARPVGGSVVVNLRGVELRDVAEQVSRITGRTIILDPSVQGTVNVVSAEPLSAAGVWDLFQSVLRASGFAVVRNGAVYRVVPQTAVASSGTSIERRRGSARSQDVVTRLIRLRNLPSEQAVRVLRPLVASFGSLEGVTEPNAIIVTDYADNVRRIEALAQQLDAGGGPAAAVFDTIQLRFGDARAVGTAIQRILGEPGEAGGPRVAVDERSNIVIVRGDRAAIEEARRVAAALDVPGGAAPITRVFRLQYGDAETVAGVIQGVLGGGSPASNPVARALGSGGQRIGAGATNRFERQAGQQSRLNPIGALAGGGLASGALAAASQGAAVGGLAAGTVEAAAPVAPTETPGDLGAGGFAVPDLAIQPAPELNAIVARGSAAQLSTVEQLIRELDVRRPQVMIEAAIVEITGDRAEQLGVQLLAGQASFLDGGAAATSFSNIGVSVAQVLGAIGGAGARAILGDGLQIGIGSRGDFGVLIAALGTSANANLLSTPSVTTLDNEAAEIVVAQQVPFRTGSFGTDGGGTLAPFTTIEREDVGITLRVIPRVHEGDTVRLQVSQEVSSLAGSVAGAADLLTNRRSIQTSVLADDGETIVLGGLITDDRIDVQSRVPVLGDIPVIGNLFRSRRENTTRRTLFIFLRPTILRTGREVTAAAQQQYYRLRLQDAEPERQRSLLVAPTAPRLRTEIEGVY